MSREILFRGKRLDNGEWVEGLTLQWVGDADPQHEKRLFLTPNGYSFPLEVDPETVCQYTGLTDKNGRKIFEGDIVLFTDNIKIKGTTSHTSKVEWNTEIGGFVFHAECIGYYNVNPSQIERYEIEVIGNIFDNPELIS